MKIRRVDFSPDEWLSGTQELSQFDRGVYITICALIYSRGERINEELLFRHSIEHGNAIRAALARLEKARKIVRNGLEIGQKRSENELETAQKRLGKRLENLGKANDAKALDAAPAQIDSHAHVTINHQPSTIKDSPNGESVAPRGAAPNGHAPPAKAKSNGSKRYRLPADWEPSDEDRKFARSLGLDPDRVKLEFREYWAGRRIARPGWSGTFQARCEDLAQRRSPRADHRSGSLLAAARLALGDEV